MRWSILSSGALVIGCAFQVVFAQSSPAHFGRQAPNGEDAVNYIYGAEGMWRDQTGLFYQWNYYERCATSAHPFDRGTLIRDGSTTNVTAADAGCLVLGDLDDDGEITNDSPAGFAFVEHTGRGVGGLQTARPFYQFWFDDNWVARYMAQTYQRPEPIGLHDHGRMIRWRLIGGDNSYWTLYPPDSNGHNLAFNGLYLMNAGDFSGALALWLALLDVSGATWDEHEARYSYPGFTDTYQIGMWAILSERLLAASPTFPERDQILQHAISMHLALLAMQERDSTGARLGWRTSFSNPHSLINTETLAVAVLALGANADWVFEPDFAPLAADAANVGTRTAGVLSAVPGASASGVLLSGPGAMLPVGTYDFDFALRTRSPTPGQQLANVSVSDGAGVLTETMISTNDIPADGRWIRYRVTTAILNPANVTRFTVSWPGHVDLDVSSVRVIRTADAPSAAASAKMPALPIRGGKPAIRTSDLPPEAPMNPRTYKR